MFLGMCYSSGAELRDVGVACRYLVFRLETPPIFVEVSIVVVAPSRSLHHPSPDYLTINKFGSIASFEIGNAIVAVKRYTRRNNAIKFLFMLVGRSSVLFSESGSKCGTLFGVDEPWSRDFSM